MKSAAAVVAPSLRRTTTPSGEHVRPRDVHQARTAVCFRRRRRAPQRTYRAAHFAHHSTAGSTDHLAHSAGGRVAPRGARRGRAAAAAAAVRVHPLGSVGSAGRKEGGVPRSTASESGAGVGGWRSNLPCVQRLQKGARVTADRDTPLQCVLILRLLSGSS